MCREPQKSDVCASVVRPSVVVRRPSAPFLIDFGPRFESNLLACMVFSGYGKGPERDASITKCVFDQNWYLLNKN